LGERENGGGISETTTPRKKEEQFRAGKVLQKRGAMVRSSRSGGLVGRDYAMKGEFKKT